MTTAGNIAHNGIALLWNGTIGMLLEGSKGMGNFTIGIANGEYNNTNLANEANQFQKGLSDYITDTPRKTQLSDLATVASNPASYEILVMPFLGSFGTLSKIEVATSKPYEPL